MNMSLAQQALALSSGTISLLINCERYDVIDAVQNEFVCFCQTNPGYPTWSHAWREFERQTGITQQAQNMMRRYQLVSAVS
jgi:hypothetical protein